MKPSLGLALVFVLAVFAGWQDPSASRPASRPSSRAASRASLQDAKGKVTEADTKKLADLLTQMSADPSDTKYDAKKVKQAGEEFKKEYERLEGLVKPAPLLGLPEVWNEVFYACRSLVKAPSGIGRIEEKAAGEFHYAIVLPNGFDVKKRYPLIVALHDKAAKDEKITGAKYLEEVWMKQGVIPKEERDKFIIVAPNLGGAAWGSVAQMRVVFGVLHELLTTYPVDNERKYLEGAGDGGELAWQLALYKPHLWAGVAIRSALPKVLQMLPNCVALPVQAHLRVGTPQQSGPARDKFDKERKDLPIEVKEHPAPDKPARSAFAADALADATPAIATFFGGKARNLAPKKLTFLTDSGTFRECYWAQLNTFETGEKPGEKFAKLVGVVDEKNNAIDIQTEGVEMFKIYLNDRLLNLDRPVKVTVNGKEHTDRLFSRDLKTLLNYYKKNPWDPGLEPSATLEVKVPAAVESKPTVPESAPAPAAPK